MSDTGPLTCIDGNHWAAASRACEACLLADTTWITACCCGEPLRSIRDKVSRASADHCHGVPHSLEANPVLNSTGANVTTVFHSSKASAASDASCIEPKPGCTSASIRGAQLVRVSRTGARPCGVQRARKCITTSRPVTVRCPLCRLRQIFQKKHTHKLETWQHLVLGGISGASAALATTPLDLIKTRLQVGSVTSVRQAVALTVQEQGPRGLFAGLVSPPFIFSNLTPFHSCSMQISSRSTPIFTNIHPS